MNKMKEILINSGNCDLEDISDTLNPVVKSIYRVLIHDIEEQTFFCKELSKFGFRWLSGQTADQIPKFLKLSGNLGQIMVLYFPEKKIGFCPIEVYENDLKDYVEILNSCISVEKALSIICGGTVMEKTLDITLDELLNKLSKTKEDLVMSLNNLQQYVESQEHGDLKYVSLQRMFFLKEEFENHIEDVKTHADYLEYNVSDEEAKEIILAFERKYDSNIDENTQLDCAIEQFVKRRDAK